MFVSFLFIGVSLLFIGAYVASTEYGRVIREAMSYAPAHRERDTHSEGGGGASTQGEGERGAGAFTVNPMVASLSRLLTSAQNAVHSAAHSDAVPAMQSGAQGYGFSSLQSPSDDETEVRFSIVDLDELDVGVGGGQDEEDRISLADRSAREGEGEGVEMTPSYTPSATGAVRDEEYDDSLEVPPLLDL